MSSETITPTLCPECAAVLQLPADLLAGEVLPCEDCGADLEVTSLMPLQITLAPEVEEDWGE
jgi:alpha-aminoadipate/glutamate carrier protein LysW